MSALRYAFGVHLHQPVGNFEEVFREHTDRVYRPFLEALEGSPLLPASIHLSGSLLEWLEANDARLLDLVGRMVDDGKLEPLLSGYYEPVLCALDRPDRIGQIEWMREALERRFGVEATGLWVTERVWEPDLPRDLAEAGVEYVLLDDRHFMACGVPREDLHAPWRTEAEGRSVIVLPIDERLRYLVPFRPASELASYLRELRGEGRRLAVLADDGEKFGGWPGTRKWVYADGWLERYIREIGALVEEGIVTPCTFSEAVRSLPAEGLVYLPTASYREMEGWALPPRAGRRFRELEEELGEERLAGIDGGFLRGSHWKNFLVKYRESNRMHKKTRALSTLCRERGDPDGPRRDVGRAQCNDPYWHGVFGGLYLPRLRESVWRHLARAEAELRREEEPGIDRVDLFGDGRETLWIHSARFSALVSPERGGVVEELTLFAEERNLVDVLTRRREAYHFAAVEASDGAGTTGGGEGTATIHDIERTLRLDRLPPVDLDERALGVDRLLPSGAGVGDARSGRLEPLRSWAGEAFTVEAICAGPDGVEIGLVHTPSGLAKELRFAPDGTLQIEWRWDPAAFASPEAALFASELSLAWEVPLAFDPRPAAVWRYEIRTVSKSERALERTRQGWCVTPLWRATGGRASLRIDVP